MIKKFLYYTSLFIFLFLSAISYSYSATNDKVGCAQTSMSVDNNKYVITDKSPTICEDDWAGNMRDRLFALGVFSVDRETNTFVMIGEFFGTVIWFVIAIVLGIPALYYLYKSMQNEEPDSIKKLIFILLTIIGSAALAYQPISMGLSNAAYNTFLMSANYSMRENINKQEMITLAPKTDTTDTVINSNVFANRLIQIALRNEFTERFIGQAAYSKLDSDYESNYTFFGSKKELSTIEFFKRVYACNKVEPYYLVQTMNNMDNSILDWSRTKQNTEIQFNHVAECSANFKYQKEIYGHAYSNGKILYPTLNPVGKSYANKDYMDNIAASVQMVDKLLDTPQGTVAIEYPAYKASTEAERMEMVNSGYVADYDKVKPQAAIQRVADFMYKCARDVIDSNSGSSFWTTTLADIPGAEPTIAIQAINKCRDALLGSSRTYKTEILPIYLDAQKAAVEVLKMKCNIPLDAIVRKTSIVNSNTEIPYLKSRPASDAMSSFQTSCITLNENGIFPNTSYTEEERDTSFKIIQESKISITGWTMVVSEGRNLAVVMLTQKYKSKFMPSQFSSNGYTFQSPEFFENLKAADGTSLLEANNTVIPEVVIEGDLDFNTESSYLNEQILSSNKGTEELIDSLSSEKINLSDYLDNGIATIQKNKYKIIDQTIPKNVQADLNLVKQKIREIIFSVSTTRLNNGLGFDYAGNLLDLVEPCKASSKQDCSNHRNVLGAATTGSFEMLKLTLSIGVSLKVVEKLGSEALGKSNEVVGSITGNSSLSSLTNIMKALPNLLIMGILAALGLFGTFLLWIAGLQALFVVVVFGAAVFIFATAAEMLIKCFILPILTIFKLIRSGLLFDLEVLKFIVIEVVLLVVKGYLLGKYLVIVSEFYSTFITLFMSSYFEIISNSRQNDSFIVSLFVDLSVFPVATAIQIGCLIFSAYMFNIILKSIMIISEFKFGKSNDNGFATAALLAVNANTVSKAAEKVSGAVSRMRK